MKPSIERRYAVAGRATRQLNRTRCEEALALVAAGKARIIKEFRNGHASFFIISASGHAIGTPFRSYNHLFEARLAASGNGDGLFPGCSQTGGGCGQS